MQIYIGPINWFLCLLCIAITAGFGINSPVLGEPITLANAYGEGSFGVQVLEHPSRLLVHTVRGLGARGLRVVPDGLGVF